MYLDPSLRITGADRNWSRTGRIAGRQRAFAGTNSRAKGGLHVTVIIDDAALGENIALFKNGQLAEIRQAGPSGVRFYDLDDGVFYATSTSSEMAWRVTIVGTTATVEALTAPGGGGGGESMFAFA